jgi:hypothetical protein
MAAFSLVVGLAGAVFLPAASSFLKVLVSIFLAIGMRCNESTIGRPVRMFAV